MRMATAGMLRRNTNTSPNSVSTFMATIGSGPTTTSIGGANTRGAATGVPRVLGSNSKIDLELDEILPLHRAPWLRGADRDGLAHVEARARRQGCRDRGAAHGGGEGRGLCRGRYDARHRRLDEQGRPTRALPREQEQATLVAFVPKPITV